MPRLEPILSAALSVLLVAFFFSSGLYVQDNLSPQGCRMSWMSPLYILQKEFDQSRTPLARRYSLWLYREAGWESTDIHGGVPVLFIPGNAGSSRQVRSIASSAARQYFSSSYKANVALTSRGVKPLDFFAVEFNEDLSAFHGPTIEAQTRYATAAIEYILSLYPSNTTIVIMGHSMGGIVATSLLPSHKISAIFTMSTPHRVPPARFDYRVDQIYDRNRKVLQEDPTPILSLCGGATDMMIPSEYCILPPSTAGAAGYRKTIFSSALEGSWTGVGHREMVWCHQVRWRVAKAALELTAVSSPIQKADVLDTWLRDGHEIPHQPNEDFVFDAAHDAVYDILDAGNELFLMHPDTSPKTYFIPLRDQPKQFVILVSGGTIPPVGPQQRGTLTVTVQLCRGSHERADGMHCHTVVPDTHKLIPNPESSHAFPVPNEGSDESEGVVLFEVAVSPKGSGQDDFHYVSVRIEGADGSGWVYARLEDKMEVVNPIRTSHLLFGSSLMLVPHEIAISTRIRLPNLLSHALVVYRVSPRGPLEDECPDMLLPPLLSHSSRPKETHYFPLTGLSERPLLLHSHTDGPHKLNDDLTHGLVLDIYTAGTSSCRSALQGLDIQLDWKATFGRWASRYFTAVATWAIGIVGVIIFDSWGIQEATGEVPAVIEALRIFCRTRLAYLTGASFTLSLLPLPPEYLLGNRGNAYLAFLSPLTMLVACGLVSLTWYILAILMYIVGSIGSCFSSRRPIDDTSGLSRGALISMGLIWVLVSLFIPWQVAYLVCWLMHFHRCAMSMARRSTFRWRNPKTQEKRQPVDADADGTTSLPPEPKAPAVLESNFNQRMHLLLLMTWLLPLSAPVLVVWVRTLATAGVTTPWDGDHLFLNVAPFLIIVDFSTWMKGPILEKQNFERWVSLRWAFVALSASSFLLGSRKAYLPFDVAKVVMGLVVLIRIGPRYLGRPSWSSS